MFEKEAEEYADNQIGCGDGYYEWTDVTQAYQKGAEFGYNKANEWHYVKDEKPKDDGNFICMLENGYKLECYYDPTNKRWYDNFFITTQNMVIIRVKLSLGKKLYFQRSVNNERYKIKSNT